MYSRVEDLHVTVLWKMDHDGPNDRLMRVMQWRGAFRCTLKLLVELPAAKSKKNVDCKEKLAFQKYRARMNIWTSPKSNP
jgi:hypothetical protein